MERSICYLPQGDLAALANTSSLMISCCHSGCHFAFGGIFGGIDLAGCFMSAWGRYILPLRSPGTGNKGTRPQLQCFRILIVTTLCPCNEGCRFFWFLMSPWEGNMIQMTTGRESRAEDGEILYCWHIFQERPHAFLEQKISRCQTKIWKYLSIFFFNLPCPFPIWLLSWLLTSTATRQLLACIFQMWSVISSGWFLGAEAGGREEGKE